MKNMITFLMLLAAISVTPSLYSQGNAVKEGSYYFSKKVEGTMADVKKEVLSVMEQQGFSLVTTMEMDKKLAEKLDVEMKPYLILGFCNAKYAYKVIQVEENIGLFLPCKIVLKQVDESTVEVVAVNPSSVMKMLGNTELNDVASSVTQKFREAMEML